MEDTALTNRLDRYLEIAKSIGFEVVYVEPFKSDGRDETRIVLHRPGIILKFDTYHSDSVNGGNFFYNWKPFGHLSRRMGVTSSGQWYGEGDLWVWGGDHDCRENLKQNIANLEIYGCFLNLTACFAYRAKKYRSAVPTPWICAERGCV
jgi:hypothetical protein